MSSHGTALKNKIGDTIRKVTVPAINKFNDAKVARHSRRVDREVGAIKDYRAMKDSGVGGPAMDKKRAVFEGIKNNYSK